MLTFKDVSSSVTVAIAMVIATPGQAEDAIQLPLFDGALVLTAEAGVRQDVREADGALIDFWRPVTFGPADKPIGGRMDCKLGGVRQDYSDSLFDIRKRFKESRQARKRSGLEDEDTDFTEDGDVRRLEIVGHANAPHRHYVLTYLALRSDPYLYDIRLNCEFRHLADPGDATDYAAIMRQYVDLAVPVTDPDAASSTQVPDS